jgi:hypothetical protein
MYERVVIGVDGRQGGRDAGALAIRVASATATTMDPSAARAEAMR